MALGFSGCVGGQSGSEGLCGESDGKREMMDDVFTTAAGDEDGGVDDPDAANNELVADGHDPEVQSGPTQCVPSDGKEY
jgi:hypothetical protein